MEIHNLYSFDIFLQGFFLSVCLFLGFFIIFRNNLEKYTEDQSVNNLSDYVKDTIITALRLIILKDIPELENTKKDGKGGEKSKKGAKGKKDTKKAHNNRSKYNILLLIPVGVAVSFVIGIMGNSLADEWIDSTNRNHLYLKSLWGGEISGKISSNLGNSCIDEAKILQLNTDTKKFIYKPLIKLQSFKTVFKNAEIMKHKDDINQLYYHSKHKIIENDQFKRYIRKNQIITEYSRVFAFGFYFLTISGLINLIIMIIRIFSNDPDVNGSKESELPKTEDKPKKPAKPATKKDPVTIKKDTRITKTVIIILTVITILLISFFTGINIYNILHYDLYIIPLIVILVYFGCLTFLISLHKKFKSIRFSFFIYSLLYVASIIGYFSSARIWFSSEKQVALKVYGIFKTTHLTKKINEIEYAEDVLKLKIIELEDITEAKNDKILKSTTDHE